jgi:hypothetical protein
MLVGKYEDTGPQSRPKHRWESNIEIDVYEYLHFPYIFMAQRLINETQKQLYVYL